MNWVPDRWGDTGELLVGNTVTILGLIVVGMVVRWFLHRLVDRAVRRAETGILPDRIPLPGRTGRDSEAPRRAQKARTVGSLLKSVLTGIVVAVIGTMILGLFVDVVPIVASAGIIGVALGLGAQSLVKDYLSGIFMIFEDQYAVGDRVDVGEASGTVEEVTMRVTRLRDDEGTVWFVRNGEVLRVGNFSRVHPGEADGAPAAG